jgi:5-formyltetrahydrofolate cyclo-ligase
MQTTRRALSADKRQDKSYAISARALALACYNDASLIAAYYPAGTEVDCKPILAYALTEQKKVYLPIVPSGPNKELWFGPYLSSTQPILQKNALGILEPIFNDDAITAKDLTLIFMPMLAFDVSGYRLGTGGGYYDISFQWLKGARFKKKTNCILVGLAFDCQEYPQLPKDGWDVSMDYIITESRTIKCL